MELGLNRTLFKDKICTNQDRQRRGHIFAQQMLNIPMSKGQPEKKAPRCKKSVDTLNWPLVSVSVLKMEEVTKVMEVGKFKYHHVEI